LKLLLPPVAPDPGLAARLALVPEIERLLPPELGLRPAELTLGLRLGEPELREVELALRLDELELREDEEE